MGEEQQGVVITLREVYDKVQEIASDVKSFGNNYNAIEQRVKKLEETYTWLWRTIGGAIIVTLIGLYLKK